MEHWDHVDYLPVGWNESEDLTDKVEEGDTILELFINVYLDQYRPQEFIVDDFSFDAFIPPWDNYEDQLEQMRQEERGKMVQERLP
ncbi:MAG: hypothetical protein ABSB22_15695 [Thermodesulfobacteriota bacterium]|jgi:hypothetical protein